MAAKLDELEARLERVRRSTEAGFADRARALREAAGALERGDRDGLEAIRRLVHKLRGVLDPDRHEALAARVARVEEVVARSGESGLVAAAARMLASGLERPEGDSANAALPDEPAPAPVRLGLRVVALDDDATTRRLLAITLVQVGGCEAEVVGDPRRLMELVRTSTVDLVVIDAMMPDVSGLELYRALRRERPELPVAILSAATASELGWELPSDPRLVWLRKPFRPARLVAALSSFVGGARG